MEKIKKRMKSIRVRLFLSLCIVIILIIIFLIIVNNFILETYYLYSKTNTLKKVYQEINLYYNNNSDDEKFQKELERISISNDFDILIKTEEGLTIYSTNKDYFSMIKEINSRYKSKLFNNIGKR